MNCSPMKCLANQATSSDSLKLLGSQSLISFFMFFKATRAPRRENGAKKNTSSKIGSASRAKNVGFMNVVPVLEEIVRGASSDRGASSLSQPAKARERTTQPVRH